MADCPRASHVLATFAGLSLAGGLAAQCQIVATGLGIASSRVGAVAITTWDPDGAGPLAPTAVVAANPEQIPGFAVTPLQGRIFTYDFDTGVAVSLGQALGLVRALTVLPSGELLAAGEFSSVGGGVAYLARYDGLQWASLGIAPNGPVDRVLGLANGDLVVGGRFTSIGGLPIAYLARWDGVQWSGFGSAPNARVRALEVDSAGHLVVGGDFTSIGGVVANHIARFFGSGWSPLGLGTDSPVATITRLPTGNLAVGGYFSQAGGAVARYIAQWNGANWSLLGGNADHFVFDSALLPNGDLLIRGQFYNLAGQGVGPRAVWNGATWSASPMDVRTTTVLAGTQIAWPYRQVGSALVPTAVGFNDTPSLAEVDSAGSLYVAGRFTAVEGVPAASVAKFDGAAWSALGTGITAPAGAVRAMSVDAHDDLYCGGTVLMAAGNASGYLLRWNGTAWDDVLGGTNERIDALVARPGGGVYVGGAFTMAGGVPARAIAAWNGSAWSALGTVEGACFGLATLRNGDLIAVGSFTNPASRVIRWDGSSWSALPGLTATVYCAAELPDGSLVVGGILTAGNSGFPSNVARWTGSSWVPVGTILGSVTALTVLPDGDLLTTNTSPQGQFLVRYDGTSWQPFADVQGPVLDFARMPSGSLAIVGRMTSASGVQVDAFAVLDSTCPPARSSVPSGCAAPSLQAAAEQLPWLGSTYRSAADGYLPGSLAVALVGLQSPGTALAALTPLGQPGCRLLASTEAALLLLPNAGRASRVLAIPDSPALVGVMLHEQYLELRNPAGFGAQLLASNGLRLVLGAF